MLPKLKTGYEYAMLWAQRVVEGETWISKSANKRSIADRRCRQIKQTEAAVAKTSKGSRSDQNHSEKKWYPVKVSRSRVFKLMYDSEPVGGHMWPVRGVNTHRIRGLSEIQLGHVEGNSSSSRWVPEVTVRELRFQEPRVAKTELTSSRRWLTRVRRPKAGLTWGRDQGRQVL